MLLCKQDFQSFFCCWLFRYTICLFNSLWRVQQRCIKRFNCIYWLQESRLIQIFKWEKQNQSDPGSNPARGMFIWTNLYGRNCTRYNSSPAIICQKSMVSILQSQKWQIAAYISGYARQIIWSSWARFTKVYYLSLWMAIFQLKTTSRENCDSRAW